VGTDASAPGGRFADALIDWQRRAGRHDLPWQRTRDPYRIWVSEIMLQQTQVSTVLGYYARFLERFPDVASLAGAPLDEVLRLWSGLGYYGRARNLHACAQAVVSRHGGAFPPDPRALEALPGIGRSTAAAIAAFAWGVHVPLLDGNVRRVLCRVFAVDGFPGERAVEQRLWAIAEREMPRAEATPPGPGPGRDAGRIEAWTQGLMDLGATVCVRTRPRCEVCPVAAHCEARAQGRVDALPTPRPARASDVRRAELLLLRSGDAVLLERRPPTGLWGGLWSLPELTPPTRGGVEATGTVDTPDTSGGTDGTDGPGLDAVTVAARVVARYGAPVGAPTVHGEIRHAFTHFRLRARVWSATLDAGASQVPVPGHEWLAPGEAAGAPLPRPIKTLLTGLDDPAAPG
jgi:A/G-specific adenine glycosylase